MSIFTRTELFSNNRSLSKPKLKSEVNAENETRIWRTKIFDSLKTEPPQFERSLYFLRQISPTAKQAYF